MDHFDEFDPQTGTKTKIIWFQPDGKSVWRIHEFDPQTGKHIKIHYSDSEFVKTEQQKYNKN
ncbi:DUF2963 domain-containing protein [Candidatus Phytoplasma solani]|uniref:DUF2963 domain-containing protein n=1 Tax=Candidatus Phytoplasma solani TaxID=69896 RepID=UPI0032DAE9F0